MWLLVYLFPMLFYMLFQSCFTCFTQYNSCILLFQTFHDKSVNFGSLPTALRKAMTAKFPDFDEYQLAKYNKDKSKKKKGKPRDQSKGPKEVTKKEKEKDLFSGSESGSKVILSFC